VSPPLFAAEMMGGQLEAGEGADGEDDHAQRVHGVILIPAVRGRHPANVMSLRAEWRIRDQAAATGEANRGASDGRLSKPQPRPWWPR